MTPQMIGIKRLILLAVLLAMNVIFFIVSSVFFAPQIENNTRNLQQVQREVSRYQKDLHSIKSDLTQLDDQKSVFERLKTRKFFEALDLSKQEALFTQLAEREGVEASFTVTPSVPVSAPELERAGWKLSRRSVTVKINALDDVDVYHYIHGLSEELSGYIKFKDLNIRRNLDFSLDTLRAIARGEFPAIIDADLVFDWYNAVSDPSKQTGGR